VPSALDVYDDVHGVVHLDECERELVDSPWFQRLRRLHQLALADMVFPGATQTRFAHSIGVFHLASRLADKFGAYLSGQERRELRAAALLHDVGHFPFSHTLERVYKQLAPAAGGVQNPIAGGQPGAAPAGTGGGANPPAFHERFSRRVIEETDVDGGVTRILRASGLEPARVGGIVTAAHPNLLLNQILKSDLDVDQLDYLLRDAKATGSTYGQYDLEYLFECLHIAEVGGSPVMCVHIQGLHPLEHYVMAKYFYYLCILYQKTRCIIEALLEAVALQLIHAGILPSWGRVVEGLSTSWFWDFDDYRVWEQVRTAPGQPGVDEDTRQAIDMLLRRRLPDVKAEMHVILEKGAEPPFELLQVGPWPVPNQVVAEAITRARHQDFDVLDRGLGENPGEPDVEEALQNPRPIRVLAKPPFLLRPGTLLVDAEGEGEQVALLESLADTVVGKLAGQTTHILRSYAT
jgi:HD superfamily phosphohydrolase